ncbi:MAG: hypothetical protein HY735_14000 [Verrucomicrobia bacterium]|nr:hypothetical protein [Verrucomicrobiota bacterium]
MAATQPPAGVFVEVERVQAASLRYGKLKICATPILRHSDTPIPHHSNSPIIGGIR